MKTAAGILFACSQKFPLFVPWKLNSRQFSCKRTNRCQTNSCINKRCCGAWGGVRCHAKWSCSTSQNWTPPLKRLIRWGSRWTEWEQREDSSRAEGCYSTSGERSRSQTGWTWTIAKRIPTHTWIQNAMRHYRVFLKELTVWSELTALLIALYKVEMSYSCFVATL